VARDLVALAKPRLSALVMITCTGGLALAPGRISVARAIVTILGTAAVVGAANALNCFVERDVDARMRRTRDRPLPAGRIDPFVAFALGIAVPAFALPVLALSANRVTALLAFVALVVYVGVYTPMKQRSTAALLVGAVPGAIPPLLGWTAVTGRIDAGGAALFALLFAWQIPHFLAVSLYLKEDYARGGLKVFSIVHGERNTRIAIAASAVALVPVTLGPVALGFAGPLYAGVAVSSGAALCALAFAGLGRAGGPRRAPLDGGAEPRGAAGRWARIFFFGTLVHLTVLFAALLASAR
jgi:protoheme IX farnesyltransferase